MYTLSRKSDELTDYFINQYFLKWTLLNGHGTLTVAEPLILKNVDYNVIFLSNF